ncbi:MAG: hypothetical protein K2O35_05475 [Clostridia bacterium]|nr:hypothetical protein [Clostridia bacterium]
MFKCQETQLSNSPISANCFYNLGEIAEIGEYTIDKILTIDKFGLGSYDGIVVENIIDWLKSN